MELRRPSVRTCAPSPPLGCSEKNYLMGGLPLPKLPEVSVCAAKQRALSIRFHCRRILSLNLNLHIVSSRPSLYLHLHPIVSLRTQSSAHHALQPFNIQSRSPGLPKIHVSCIPLPRSLPPSSIAACFASHAKMTR